MTNAKVSEIFSSIQGEGKYAGVKQVFVRFFECNIHCVWCDTPASIGDTSRHYQQLSLEEVFTQILQLWDQSHSVTLTGGEPLLQKDFIKCLLPKLKARQMPVYLETSGILYQELAELMDCIDIVAMDIKLPSSTKIQPFWDQHEAFLKTACRQRQADVFLKTVISSDTEKNDIERAVDLVAKINPGLVFILQPNTYELKNGAVGKCLEFQDYCLRYLPNARIMPQMHKFMKLR